MFNSRQQALLITAFIVLAVYFLVRIGGQETAAALIWAVVLGVTVFFLLRQNLLVRTGEDALEDLCTVTTDFAQTITQTAPPGKPAAQPEATPTASTTARPAYLDGPRDGGADDLKRITGIGPKLEENLNDMGYFHFDQIAAWTPREVDWIDENVEGLRGRANRDDWVAQAAALSIADATGTTTED